MRKRAAILFVILLVAAAATVLFVRASVRSRFGMLTRHGRAPNSTSAWDWEHWGRAEGFINVDTEEGLSQLHRAAGKGDLQALMRLLSRHENLSARDKDGWTPLHWAAYEGQTEAVKFLLSKGAPPNAHAYELGRLGIVFWTDIRPAGTPEMWRSVHKRVNSTPLKAALAKGRRAAAEVLLRLGVSDKQKDQLLLWAATWGYGGGAAILLASGAHVDASDNDGWTALHWAAETGSPDVVRALLSGGANPNARTRSKELFGHWGPHRTAARETPLHLGVDNAQVVRLLVAAGADVNVKDGEGATPLHDAARYGDVDSCQVLLAEGARVDARDASGRSALFDAAMLVDNRTATLLLSRGADVNLRDNNGETVLHTIVGDRLTDGVRFLLDHRADPSMADNKGRTPIHVVAAIGTVEQARLLIAKGADPHRRDKAGMTPYDVALAKGNREVAIFLGALSPE